jgi:hypothetical protein
MPQYNLCYCEEQSDEAIPDKTATALDCFAPLAMTNVPVQPTSLRGGGKLPKAPKQSRQDTPFSEYLHRYHVDKTRQEQYDNRK